MGREEEEVQDFGLQAHHSVAARAPDQLGVHGRSHTGTSPGIANMGIEGMGKAGEDTS